MRALVADLRPSRAAWTAVATRVRQDAAWRRGGILRLEDLPPPPLFGDDWLLVRPTMAGICGSDLKLLHVTGFSPVLTAYNPSTRAVLGHEVVGVVERAGPGVTTVSEGDRVLVEPILSCRDKGLVECARCRAGEDHLCENLALAGDVCVGQGIGFNERVGGGWSEAVAVPQRRVWPAAGIPDTRAVLAEPAAVALHAALRWESGGETAAVIGPGSIGLLVIAALRRLHPDLDLTAVGAPSAAPQPFGAEQARIAGADRVWTDPPARVVERAATHLSTRLLRPRIGRLPVLAGGLDLVVDCIATTSTIDLALRLLRPRGTLVLVGTAGRQRVDWSLLWWRELRLLGSVVYAVESDGRRTFARVREWLADPSYPVDLLVTHRYPLEEYEKALSVAAAGPRARAVKVVFTP